MTEDVAAQVYYDLRGLPITFDAATYFAFAMGTLRLQGYRVFEVNLVAPDYRTTSTRDKVYSEDQKDWQLSNLIMKLPLFIPGVQHVYLSRSARGNLSSPRFPETYGISETFFPYLLLDLAKVVTAGGDVHVFDASAFAKALRVNGWAPTKPSS